MMHRRRFLTAAVAAPLVSAIPALAQSGVQVTARAGETSAFLMPSGRGFLLEVSGLRLSLSVPPGSQLGNFEIQDLMNAEADVAYNTRFLTLGLSGGDSFRFNLRDGGSGRGSFDARGRSPAMGFLVIVTGMAAALGAAGLGRGGEGQVAVGRHRQGFLLDVSG